MQRKTLISILLGLSGLFFSWFGFLYDLVSLQVIIPFYVVFPLIAALSYGLRLGLVAAFSGFFLFPFLFLPDHLPLILKILHSFGLVLWIALHGFMVDWRTRKGLNPLNPILVQFLYIPIQSILFLGLPSSIDMVHLMTTIFTMLLMVAMANAIISTPLLRTILHGNSLSSRISHHLNLVMLGSIVLGMVLIVIISAIHHVVHEEPFSWVNFFVRKDNLAFTNTVVFCCIAAGGGFAVKLLEQSLLRESYYQLADFKYKILFNGLSTGVVFQAQDGHVVEANDSAPRILGLTMDQLLGKTSLDPRWKSIHPDGSPLPGEEHPAEIVLRTGQKVLSKPMGIFNPSTNKYTWIETDAWPLEIEGSDIKVVAIFKDVTPLYEAQQALTKSESNYRQAFAKSSMAFALHEIITNESGIPVDYKFLAVNQAFESMTGLVASEIVNRNIKEVYPGVEEIWIQNYGRVALEGEFIQLEEKTGLTNRIYRVNAYQPAYRQFAVLFVDVTPFHEARQALEQSQKALELKNSDLESLLHMLSHDLRAPLVNLEGYNAELTQIIKEWSQDPTNENLRKEIEQAQSFLASASNRMGSIIAGALRLSRIGRSHMVAEEINMNHVLAECLKVLNYQLQERHAVIESTPLPACYGDPGLLSQVFVNLIDNAMKYSKTETAPKIQITGEQQDFYSLYRVRDFGIGISVEYLPQVFKPFHRLNTHAAVAGEGLGLALVKRMVEIMRGHIYTEQPQDGQGGIIFTFKIPTKTIGSI